MQRLFPTFAQAPNTNSLVLELNAALSIVDAACGFEGAGNYFVEVPDNITLQQVQTVVDAHDPATLTSEQQKSIARTLMLSTAKNYLSDQLGAPNPNVPSIFTQVRDYVDGHPILTQMVTNEITLAQTAFGWTLNLATPTPTDRMRYLIIIQLVMATIA